MAVLLLLQVPPLTPSVSSMLSFWHTTDGPRMAVGVGLTVTVVVTKQMPMAYVMVAVPTDTPQVIPVAPTVATAVLLLLQVPPPTASPRVVQVPTHILPSPVMGAG